ncbi:MAG: nuclear transport factor 2 family protein [Motilibacteraceae bacterium]
MVDYQRLAQSYLDVWNETDAELRAQRLLTVFRDDVGYVDPLAQVRGADALFAVIGAVHQQFPGWVFRLAGPVDGHHGRLRFSWALGPDGAPVAPVVGFDVAVLAEDGRITDVHGFLDQVPS